jgi:hypothetical protein
MTCGPACIALIQGIPTGLATITVGLLAWTMARRQADIAHRQAAIAEGKFKLDLFERRYPIFEETWKIMSETVMRGTREKNFGLSHPFANFTPSARFLFGPDVGDYLSKATSNWIELNGYEGEREDAAARAQNAARVAELKHWFHAQASSGVKDVFAPYLSFEKWR